MADVVVVGAGPAGVIAALRAADLGAQTVLITKGQFGGMAANDGPVPVRVLAHTARLVRQARQSARYGIAVAEPVVDYGQVLRRAQEVVHDVQKNSSLRTEIDAAGVTVREHAGVARFADPHTITTDAGWSVKADKVILCTGGVTRRLPIPGFELTGTHSDAWRLRKVPKSMVVLGGGNTGVQVASIFNALGAQVHLFEASSRILATEDEAVAAVAAGAFREAGMVVREGFGVVDAFEKTQMGIRMRFSKDGHQDSVEAELVIVATGWAADTARLNLPAARVEIDRRGFIEVDGYLRTSSAHVFAAGDVIGRLMLVPEAIHGGFVAATNAVRGPVLPVGEHVSPWGSFTDPEYAQAGLTEEKARAAGHDVVTSVVPYNQLTRAVIDGHTLGFCKLVADRKTARILGVHVIGERAVDIAEVGATAITAGMRTDDLARIPLAYPTYGAILERAAVVATRSLGIDIGWQAYRSENIQRNPASE